MSKLRSSLILLATASLATSIAYAELFSFEPNTTQTAQAGTDENEAPTPPPTPPLSADNFKTQAAVQGQKAQQELFQQTQGQMPISKPKPPQLNQQQSSSTPSTENQTSTTPTTATPESNQTTVTTTTTTAAPTSAPVQQPPIMTSPNPAPATAPTPAQGQVYTGFSGGGNSPSNTTSTPSSTSNGGWNVKY